MYGAVLRTIGCVPVLASDASYYTAHFLTQLVNQEAIAPDADPVAISKENILSPGKLLSALTRPTRFLGIGDPLQVLEAVHERCLPGDADLELQRRFRGALARRAVGEQPVVMAERYLGVTVPLVQQGLREFFGTGSSHDDAGGFIFRRGLWEKVAQHEKDLRTVEGQGLDPDPLMRARQIAAGQFAGLGLPIRAALAVEPRLGVDHFLSQPRALIGTLIATGQALWADQDEGVYSHATELFAQAFRCLRRLPLGERVAVCKSLCRAIWELSGEAVDPQRERHLFALLQDMTVLAQRDFDAAESLPLLRSLIYLAAYYRAADLAVVLFDAGLRGAVDPNFQ